MSSDTKGVPDAVARLTVPEEPPKHGLQLSWRFTNSEIYTLVAEPHLIVANDNGWQVTTQEGRVVYVYAQHVMVFETKPVTIKARKTPNDG
jgi:hypothetical protein